MGAASGGLIGGITSVMQGGSFLEGVEEGAFSGAITGAIMGGIGGAGAIFGKSVSCLSNLGKAIKMTAKITGGISSVMGGFDTLAMGLGMLDPNNPLTALNSKLHQSTLYNRKMNKLVDLTDICFKYSFFACFERIRICGNNLISCPELLYCYKTVCCKYHCSCNETSHCR